MKILWSFTQYHVVLNLYASFVEHKRRRLPFTFFASFFHTVKVNGYWGWCLTSPFCQTKKVTQVWNNMSMIKWWQSFLLFYFFRLNNLFKLKYDSTTVKHLWASFYHTHTRTHKNWYNCPHWLKFWKRIRWIKNSFILNKLKLTAHNSRAMAARDQESQSTKDTEIRAHPRVFHLVDEVNFTQTYLSQAPFLRLLAGSFLHSVQRHDFHWAGLTLCRAPLNSGQR